MKTKREEWKQTIRDKKENVKMLHRILVRRDEAGTFNANNILYNLTT